MFQRKYTGIAERKEIENSYALCAAVVAGDLNQIALLIKQHQHDTSHEYAFQQMEKSFINQKSPAGNLALHEGMKILATCQSLHDMERINKIVPCIKLLLEKDADPSLKNASFETAIDCCIKYLPTRGSLSSQSHYLKAIKGIFQATTSFSPDIITLCGSYIPEPAEEALIDVLQTLYNRNKTLLTENHFETLIKKGFTYTVEILRQNSPGKKCGL